MHPPKLAFNFPILQSTIANPIKLRLFLLSPQQEIGGEKTKDQINYFLLTLSNLTTVSYMVMLLTLPYCTRKSMYLASVLFASISEGTQANEMLVFVTDVT